MKHLIVFASAVLFCALFQSAGFGESPSSRKAGDRMVLTVDGIEFAFRWCPPGEFMMGSSELETDRSKYKNLHRYKISPNYAWNDERPVHKVQLTRGFWLLETEVTQAMWLKVMRKNPSFYQMGWFFREHDLQRPVESVTWGDCQEFCQKLSQKLDRKVQLPTEAQWEYACRAGTTGPFAGDIDSMGWYCENSEGKTHTVGQKKPNAWGLYDMHGNVKEWCSDFWDKDFYEKSPLCDPENTAHSIFHVLRGGCYHDSEMMCRSADRFAMSYDSKPNYVGLRVLLVPDSEE